MVTFFYLEREGFSKIFSVLLHRVSTTMSVLLSKLEASSARGVRKYPLVRRLNQWHQSDALISVRSLKGVQRTPEMLQRQRYNFVYFLRSKCLIK